MQLGLQKLKCNQLIEGLSYFVKHKPFDEAAKVLIKYCLTQDLTTREYILFWMVKKIQSSTIKLDCLNLLGNEQNNLGCTLSDNQKQIEILNEALELTVRFELNPSATLINLTCIYSKMNQHEKALQLAQQSINCASGKQLVIAYHNAAIECKALQQFEQSRQFHENAYQLSLDIYGEDDALTKKMNSYLITLPMKKVAATLSNQFRLRSASKHSDQAKSFYYKRQSSRNDSFVQSFNSINNSLNDSQQKIHRRIKEKKENPLKQARLIYDSDEESSALKESVEQQQQSFLNTVKLMNQFNQQQQIRVQFLETIHNECVKKLEKRCSVKHQINLSQESIPYHNICYQNNTSQEYIYFENQQPDGKYDSMIPMNQQQNDVTMDDQELILKQIQGFDTNKDITGISFANQDTIDNTFEQHNRKGKAASKIQIWYRKKSTQKKMIRLTVNLTKQQNAAKKIQQNYKLKKYQETYTLYKQQPLKSFIVLKKMKVEEKEKYFRIIGKLSKSEIQYTLLEVTDRKNKKKGKKYIQIYSYQHLRKKYLQFDEFYQIVIMPESINKIAYKQKVQINYKDLCGLFYMVNDTVHLYGVTDSLYQEDQEYTNKEISFTQQVMPQLKLSKLMKLQSLLRGYLARIRQEIIQNQIYKKKRFIEKISGNFFQVIFKADNIIQCYNVEKKQLCENELLIPQLILKFYGPITRQNCSEILSVKELTLTFSEDAQYLIDKDIISKKQVAQTTIVKAAEKLQRAFRSKLKVFGTQILIHKQRSEKAKEIITLFQFRKACLFDQKYHIMLTASGQIIKGNQQLLIEGGISSKSFAIPSLISQCQRLFQPLEINDLLQISKIILEEIKFIQKSEKIYIQCYSIEEVYGFLQQREFNTFKQSQTSANRKEPTHLGRNYLSKKIYCNQYLDNRFELEDKPQVYCQSYDPSRYQISYIKNRYLERKKKQYVQRQNEKQVLDINEYVNSFPSVFQYDWIADPEEMLQKQMEKSAKIVQRAFRLLKFRVNILQRCQQRKKRKQAMLEAQKVVEKPYYYDDIRKTQPYTTPEILQRRGEAVIMLQQIQVSDIVTEWIIVLPYQDIIVTVYSNLRKFYQIKYQEYVNHYIDIILSEPIDKIQKYFCAAIGQYGPDEKVEFINELREQFSRKVIRAVRLKLFCKKLREMPISKQFLVRTFVNDFFVKINYSYNREDQRIIVLLQKEKFKRKYFIELYYLDCLYGSFHMNQSVFLDRDQFIKLLTLNEPKSYHKYRQLLMPLINILHSYMTVNSALELSFEFKGDEIPISQLEFDRHYTSSQGFRMNTNESVQKILPTVILLQSRWRLYCQRQNYQLQLSKCKKITLKMMNKKGRVIHRTFIKRQTISNEKESIIVYLCTIYKSIEVIGIKIRVDLISYKGQQPSELYNIFTFDSHSTLINEQLGLFVLRNLFIEENKLILKQPYEDKIPILTEPQTNSMRLITKKPSSPKLIYHQKRQYTAGQTFTYDAIHTGEMPLQHQISKNTIKIDIDLKELKAQYPGINFKQSNVLPQISEQLISGLKINKQVILSKSLISKRSVKVQGICNIDEQEKQINLKQSKKANTLLLRFTQFYKKFRYMITISQLDIPIESNERLDNIYEPYQSFINITAHNQLTNKIIQWQMNLLQANELTNLQDNIEIAKYIKQNMLVLDQQFIFIADYSRFEFENVLMFQRQTIVLIQKMIKNRRFKKLRKEFEKEIKQLKQSDNQFWNNMQQIIKYKCLLWCMSILIGSTFHQYRD